LWRGRRAPKIRLKFRGGGNKPSYLWFERARNASSTGGILEEKKNGGPACIGNATEKKSHWKQPEDI